MTKIKKKKDKKKLKEPDFLKPINVFELGTDMDPCFAKGYDLTTPECQRCGDSELCAIATAQKLNGVRKQIEKEKEFKDIGNKVESKALVSFIKKRIKKEYKLSRIRKLAIKKFGATPEEIKTIYKSLK